MGEVKSVKVDNWGVFFLQKLQNFFNKTDYCDLTLQFNDNSQLKVHRLVLSACTDYFNVLEQTCEVVDDVLVMPRELQADVVVPIVNFMYTGTLEFEINMYARLLKTARDMNMTVLLKLLEAHKRTVEGSRAQILNRVGQKIIKRPTIIKTQYEPRSYASPSSTANQKRVQPTLQTAPVTQYKSLQIKPITPSTSFYPKTLTEPVAMMTKYGHSKTTVKGPSRFDCVDETILPPESFEQSFDNISYESKPLITATQICKEERDLDDYDNIIRKHETTNTSYSSQFEQLKRSYTGNNKRPASSASSFESPPEKKPNIQDVKEYAEQQRMRKQIAAEFDEDNEYDDVLDDEFHNDDDDDDYVPPVSYQKQINKQQYHNQKPIVIKQEKDQKPTIVVKDSAGSNVNHAKIISEVLKKYPHLVKNNKNIKLKIMPKSGSSPPQKIVIKQETPTPEEPVVVTKKAITKELIKKVEEKKMIAIPVVAPTPATAAQPKPTASLQTRRIDSKTMHALIAMGAENTTGPWLCLQCGIDGRPISIPSYRGFRRHLINTHKEKIDPRLCEHCGYRSSKNRELFHHMLTQHSIKAPFAYNFPKCDHCSAILIDDNALEQHMSEIHPEKIKEENQQCIYCNKSFDKEILLYAHMRNKHKNRAREDGVMDFSDEEASFDDNDSNRQTIQTTSEAAEKIKILSNISLPKNSLLQATESTVSLEPSSEAEGLSNVATGIATSLGLIDSTNTTAGVSGAEVLSEQYIDDDFDKKVPKFVNADGNVMNLTPAQQQEIISQLDQQHGDLVMVLNQETFNASETTETSNENTTAATQHEFVATGDQNMFIVYSEADAAKSNEQSETKKAVLESAEDENESQASADDSVRDDLKADKLEEALKAMEEGTEIKDEKELDTSVDMNSSDDKKESLLETLTEKIPIGEEENESKNETTRSKSSEKDDEAKLNKLKLLTGDWTEDEDDDEEVEGLGKERDKMDSSMNEKSDKGTPCKTLDTEEVLFETITNVDPIAAKDTEEENPDPVKIEEETKIKNDSEIEVKKKDEVLCETDDDEIKKNENIEVAEKKIPEKEVKSEEKKDKDETEAEEEDEIEEEEDEKEVEIKTEIKDSQKHKDDRTETENDPLEISKSKDETLITKAEIRNLISDWGDDDEDDDEI